MKPLSPVKRELLRVGLPAVSGFVGVMIYQLIDMFWIAKLGTDIVAGVAASEYWMWAFEATMGATTVGATTLISQHVGAGDLDGARKAAREAAQLSLIVAAAIALSFYPSGEALLTWMGLSGAAHAAGWTYIRLILAAMPVIYLTLLANQVFAAHADTKTNMIIMTAALLLNAVLDPFMIFGWWIFPEMGVAGAAWSSVIGWVFGLVLRIVYLLKRGYIPPLREFLFLSTDFWRRILKVGIPTAASHLIWTSVYPLLTTLITLFGMGPLAGMTIAHRFESVAYFTCLGFSLATATLVGQAAGRGGAEEARAIAYEARTLITWLLLPIAAAFLFVPEPFIGLMTRDPEVIAHGSNYLRAIGLFEIFLGWELVFEGGFNGLGSTRRYMAISVPLTLGRYPAAFFLIKTLALPVGAIWWCISVSTLLKGLLMNWLFRHARVADLGLRRPAVSA